MIVADCEYRSNVPRCWLEVLKDEMLASRTAHVPHDASGFTHLLRCIYHHLPVRYMRMLHDIIWEQTKNYLAGGHRGLNGLSHPLSPQNYERGEEFFKEEEDRWKMGVCIQIQAARDSLKEWLYLVDNDPLDMVRELRRASGQEIALIICGDEKPGGHVEEGGFCTEEELFHRTDLKRFTDKMRISSMFGKYVRSMRMPKGGVSWLYSG